MESEPMHGSAASEQQARFPDVAIKEYFKSSNITPYFLRRTLKKL
jgi:hypothetical protein